MLLCKSGNKFKYKNKLMPKKFPPKILNMSLRSIMCATILRENNFAEPTLWKAQLCRTETLDNWVKFGNLFNNIIEKFLKNSATICFY